MLLAIGLARHDVADGRDRLRVALTTPGTPFALDVAVAGRALTIGPTRN